VCSSAMPLSALRRGVANRRWQQCPKGAHFQFWQSTIHAPADQLLVLARHAEDLGFEGAMGPDHTVWWGSNIASKYPYNDTGSIWWPEEAHWPDPWVSTAAMAAVHHAPAIWPSRLHPSAA